MTNVEIDWGEFEDVVAKLHRAFYPSARIERNTRVMGKNSKTFRELDVVIRQKLGVNELLIIVECKHWSRVIDIKAVEGFAAVREDVDAHVAMMISSKGFSKSAAEYAKSKQISLFTHKDTRRDDWPNGLESPIVLEAWMLKPVALYVKDGDGKRTDLESDLELDIHETNSNRPLTISGICRMAWEGYEPKTEGTFFWEFPCTDAEGKSSYSVGIGFNSKFSRTLRIGRLHFEGLVDNQGGRVHTPGFRIEVSEAPVAIPDRNSGFERCPSLGLVIRTTIMETQDPTHKMATRLIFSGEWFLEAMAKDSMTIPLHMDTKQVSSSRHTRQKSGKP